MDEINANGQYYKDLNGNALWVIVDTTEILQGKINIEPVIRGPEHGT